MWDNYEMINAKAKVPRNALGRKKTFWATGRDLRSVGTPLKSFTQGGKGESAKTKRGGISYGDCRWKSVINLKAGNKKKNRKAGKKSALTKERPTTSEKATA